MGKRILLLATGGTIGCRRSPEGYVPETGFLAAQLAALPELRAPEMPAWELEELDPPLDSSDMLPGDWLRIARRLGEHWQDYDGFVVLHGTDTVAYTAAALAFMLEGLDRAVILTGSQIPLCEVRNDARSNVVTSLLLAGGRPIPEVCLFFGHRLLRGCRATKVDAVGFDAFQSPNFPALGRAGLDLQVRWDLVRPPAPRPGGPAVHTLEGPRVGALRLFPGISAEVLENVLRPPLQGLVLEAFGIGNGPTRDPEFLRVLQEATAPPREVVVVVTSQCRTGDVRLEQYATGRALAAAGCIPGGDMTKEAALTKLHYLLNRGLSPTEVRAAMQRDLRGELTERPPGRGRG